MKIILLLLLISNALNAIDITKFVTDLDGNTNNLGINVDATGNELTQLIITIKNQVTQKLTWSRTYQINKLDRYSKSEYYPIESPGNYIVKATVYDAQGNPGAKTKYLHVPNRPPVKPTIVLSNYSPEMGGSITITGQTRDLDRNLGRARVILRGPDGLENPIYTQSVTAQEDYNFNTSHEFKYVNPSSFGEYKICTEITDQSGANVRSDWVTVSPSNPTKTMTIYTQARAEGEMAKWYDHSNVVSKTVTVRKYKQ